MSEAMSELGRHTTMQALTVCEQEIDRCSKSLCQALQHACAGHVLVRLVSPQRVRADANARREFNLGEARAHASLA